MGDRVDPEVPASLAGLSEGAPTTATPVAGAPSWFAGEADARYRDVRVVGTGGLGTVLLVHDQRLDREVALKRIGPGGDTARAEARFAREARITARLDHPGIVAVHDAGVTADGRLYYTMRLVRGRSLAELMAAARDTEARLALVPALTAACHAVAHAHQRGIVHRDLKPANVMVGELGETQVVDWGLAEELAVLTEAREGGAIVGTPAYLSPEVARGEPATSASDTWALGVMLHELLAGARRVAGDRDAAIASLRRGLPPADWPDDVPAELRAIAERAMAADRERRYADAEAMARDLEAFRDGRRVAAHRYSARELAWRAVVALRWPLAVASALIVAIIGSLALTAHRTEQQRARAERALVAALASEAVSALEHGHEARAEELATRALAGGESPDARGVLAATFASPRPRTIERIELPGCSGVVPVDGERALCAVPGRVELWTLRPPRRAWRADAPVERALALEDAVVAWSDAGEVRVLDARDGGVRHAERVPTTIAGAAVDPDRVRVALHDRRDVLVVRAGGGAPTRVAAPCGTETIEAIAGGATRVWIVCARGALRTIDDDGRVADVAATGFGVERRPASALGVGEQELSVAIGGLGGDVAFHDLRPCFDPSCESTPRVELATGVSVQAIRAIVELGDAALVVADDGDAVELRRGSAAELRRLPVAVSSQVIALETDLVTGGRDWRRHRAAGGAARRIQGGFGITTGALWPDDSLIAAAGEDGVVAVWSTRDGGRVAGLEVGFGGVAAIAPSPDGRFVRVEKQGGDEPRTQLWAVDGWRLVPITAAPPWPTPADDLVAREGDHAVRIGRRRFRSDDATIVTAAVSEDKRWLAIATSVGRIDVFDVRNNRLAARLHGHRQRVTWLAFRRDALWSAGFDGALLRWSVRAFAASSVDEIRE